VTKPADLIAYVFEGQPHLLSEALMQWMEASSRFTDFVETYRDKIRKKIRVTREPESVLDLFVELEVAHCLLNDRRLVVAYEPYASSKRRGPDFAVTYRANLLVIHTREELARSIDLGGLMQEVKTRAEGKDTSFYAASRYTSPAAFYKDYPHLSGILLWAAEAQAWVNKQARPGLPGKVLSLVRSLPSGTGGASID
jgi:hypothetical protein